MGIPWATERAESLLRVEEGVSGLDWDLRWTVEDSIASRSFYIPAYLKFSGGLALALTGHRDEACSLFERVHDLAGAAFFHSIDHGSWGYSLQACDLHTLLYGCDWLLHGVRRSEHLSRAVTHMAEAERRALADGFDVGRAGHEELALFHLLLGDGEKAATAVTSSEIAEAGPTGLQVLALVAHHLCYPSGNTAKQDRIREGVFQVMHDEFRNAPPHARHIVLWLDLLNVYEGTNNNPWELVDQLASSLAQK